MPVASQQRRGGRTEQPKHYRRNAQRLIPAGETQPVGEQVMLVPAARCVAAVIHDGFRREPRTEAWPGGPLPSDLFEVEKETFVHRPGSIEKRGRRQETGPHDVTKPAFDGRPIHGLAGPRALA